MTAPGDLASLLDAIPKGTSRGSAQGKRYIATKTLFNGGRSTKLVAEELGGNDYISLNFYALAQGPRLYPCEMPSEKVIAFVRNFVPEA